MLGRERSAATTSPGSAPGTPRRSRAGSTDNGYALPPGAEPILDEYVGEGWRFVAIRLAPGADGRLKPLAVSFPTDAPVYPMRLAQLGTEPVNLTLYMLADGERQVEGLDPVFAAPVADLDPAPPPRLARPARTGRAT